MDFTQPDFSFVPQGIHEWRQQGYYLICQSCDLQHAVRIGEHKILTGFTHDGNPILQTRVALGMV